MRRVVYACLLVLCVLWPPPDGDALSRRKECRQSCGAAVDACVAAGGKRPRCKRRVLRQCRREGPTTCTVTTTSSETSTTGEGQTTTTAPSGATTTSAPSGSTTTSPGATTTTGPSDTTTTTPDATTTTTLEVHGCTVANAQDARGPAADRTVTFANYAYTPRCLRIVAGQTVTFSGAFGSHPLVGGAVENGVPTADPSSPIPVTTSGTTQDVPLPDAGVFPYFCGIHGGPPLEMEGAIFVDP